ncbi:alpha-ribazole phosphatase family protein [Cupriavidus sp.]|uniref:alpha-ribazole phosphatase family protein n=1 Tax=Cupriavidus sp. TaxID=1873897 RepID=UPI0025B8CED2|nr:alpha-ribazole phosphatase family protein [Cupriavidus sp.]MCA3183164.1 alpha-ribazole phosphatase family protein [Cupriavidus sp.]MCA3192890.1 alpha-ribazole phosphatase family protein [Cupriavidus sp.]MCA3195091.1 alpha-ribazole phosphatase family protein [Cupriavidus sp.]MCA3204061.1 alpha-ribazole phosphatase family protein [Cupriavidus sp.]MCA3209639.1 alpha-ribazole phosphatase family protein [Cupriavidus sp.]
MEILLIRHAQPEVAAGICYGSLDLALTLPLTPDPSHAVAGLAAPHRILTSPARRARDTAAQLIGCVPGLPVAEVEPRLREMDFGEWEGQPWADIPRDALDIWAADLLGARPHGGESPAQVMARVAEWADRLDIESDQRLWVVTHAGPMRMLAAHWLGISLAQTLQWSLGFGATCRFSLGGGAARLGWWNRGGD